MVTPAALANRPSAIRRRREADRATDSGLLAELADDKDRVVRLGVARNPLTPASDLARLATDENKSVAYAALGNPSLPVSARYTLARTAEDAELLTRAANCAPEAHREMLHAIIDSRAGELYTDRQATAALLQKAAAERGKAKASTSPSELEAFAESEDTETRARVARNPQTPEYTLHRLMSDPERLVRNSVSINTNLTPTLRRRIVAAESDTNIVMSLIGATKGQERSELVALARKSAHAGVRAVGESQAEKAKQEAAAKKEAEAKTRKCPTPGKKKFRTKNAALSKTVRVTRVFTGTAVRVYPCPCGHWHMTTKVKKS